MQKNRIVEHRQQPFVESAHLRVTGEEAEGAAVRDAQNALDGQGRGFEEFCRSRVGHLRRQVKQRLLFVAEVRGHYELARAVACIAQTEPLAQMFEAALYRERGRGEHGRGQLIPHKFVQDF